MSEQNQEQVVEMTELNPFSETAWVDELSENTGETNENTTEQQVENQNDVQNTQESNQSSDEDVYDADEYLKQNLGFESWEAAKEEIEKLRTSKGSKYDNEESERIHKALLEGKTEDVYSFLEKQVKINKLLSSEINDSNAEEIVKLSMKSKYADLTDSEIEYKYRKQFGIPKEPEQGYSETDEEFEARKSDWEDKVRDIKMELMIEAKTSRSQLEKIKTELKLPEIQVEEQKKELSPEELEQANKYVESYLKNVDEAMKSFNGFNVDYKDEEVTLQSAYLPSDDEKNFVSTQMKTFAENGFNANTLFADRWVNEDGTINANKMAKDLALLYSEEKIMQKLVNDGVAKRLAEYRKSTSNIKVNGQSKGTFKPEGNGANDMAAFFFGQ